MVLDLIMLGRKIPNHLNERINQKMANQKTRYLVRISLDGFSTTYGSWECSNRDDCCSLLHHLHHLLNGDITFKIYKTRNKTFILNDLVYAGSYCQFASGFVLSYRFCSGFEDSNFVRNYMNEEEEKNIIHNF